MTRLNIEFLGIPGSGKTTLARKLDSMLNNKNLLSFNIKEGPVVYHLPLSRAILTKLDFKYTRFMSQKIVQAYSRLYNYNAYHYARFSRKYPEFVDLLNNLIFNKTHKIQESYLLYSWFFGFISNYQMAKSAAHADDILIADEGFANLGVSLCTNENKSDLSSLREYLRLAPEPDIIIRTNISADIAKKRVKSRSEGYPTRFKKLTQNERDDFINNQISCINQISKYYNNSSVKKYTIDNSCSVEQATKELIQVVNKIDQDI